VDDALAQSQNSIIQDPAKAGPERRARNFAASKLSSEPRDPREKFRFRPKNSNWVAFLA
jgi:hypothetical protein